MCDDKELLGNRTNELLRRERDAPDGQIHKNETWQNALLRISEVKLGLSDIVVENFSLMGMWDHFYNNSTLDHNISTYYVNLSHYGDFKSKSQIIVDDQHYKFKWFDLSVVSNDEKHHHYKRNYANWLLDRIQNIHD